MRYIKILSIFILLIQQAFGQSNLNEGLKAPQDPATLPKSLASVVKPIRKAKLIPYTQLKPTADGDMEVTGGWEMIEAGKISQSGAALSKNDINTSAWYNAVVPGTVLTSLVNQGVYPDPYFGLNNLAIPDSLCRENWWYRTKFEVPLTKRGKNAWIIIKGINYSANIWLNGKLLGTLKGAFQRGRFNVSQDLNKVGKNVLAIEIIPPPNPGIPHEESPGAGTGPNGGQLVLDGPTFFATEGWDWIPGIRDRDIGVWQPVSIRFTDAVTIGDAQVITQLPLPDTTSADISIRVPLTNVSPQQQQVNLIGDIGDIHIKKHIILQPGQQETILLSHAEFAVLHVMNPRLWWPNGYGKPELYGLKLSVQTPNSISDTRYIRFGIRELSYVLTVDMPDKKGKRIDFDPTRDLKESVPVFDNIKRRIDENGIAIPSLKPGVNASIFLSSDEIATAPYMIIKVNGQKIYCRGGNWGMDDAMKNVSREHLEPYFRLHRDENFNMVRNWTGHCSEETFYDLCDEYGMLVWNDFWLSTEGYNLAATDHELYLANAKEVIDRFRNHPSIAIWCARNEGYAPPDIEPKLAEIIAKDDGTRYYQSNSTFLNMRTSGPYLYFAKPEEYYTRVANGFDTELGTPSIPTAATIRSMMAKADTWPISDVWYYHDFHNGQKVYLHTLDSLYGKPDNLDDFCKKAQMLNYDSHRAMFESWNSKLWNNTTGLLLWMSHPAWPSTVWQTYSSNYETFGSYFGAKKACEPIHIQMNLSDQKVVVINNTFNALPVAEEKLTVYNVYGKPLYNKKANMGIASNSLTNIFEGTLPQGLPVNYLVRLELINHDGRIISRNDYWKTTSKDGFKDLNNLPQIVLQKTDLTQNNITGKRSYNIRNNGKVAAIAIKLNLTDKASGKIVLPAYFSDGYFNLLPGESRLISVEYHNAAKVNLIAEGYNIKSAVVKE
jgi:hypothetical protein